MRMNALLLAAALQLTTGTATAQPQELRIAAVERNAVGWVAAQLLGDVYKEAGLALRILPMPASRANLAGTTGQVDGELIRIHSYGQRHPQLLRIEPPLYRLAVAAYSLPARSARVSSREDLQHYSMGTVRGLVYAQELTEGHPSVTLTLNVEQLLRMLQAGRIDLALETRLGARYAQRRLGLQDLVPSPDLARLDLYHYLDRRHSALAVRLSEALARLRARGDYERLIARYEAEVMTVDLEQWGEPRPAKP